MHKDTKDFLQGLVIIACFVIAVSLFPYIFTGCEEEEPGQSRDERMAEEYAAQEEYMEQERQSYYAEKDRKAEQAGAIDWAEAEDHIGEYVTIYGEVKEVSQPGVNGDPIFVDIGNAYPGDRVTGVCWSEYHSSFDNLFDYEGSLVLMQGTLYLNDGTPNIELTDSFQIEKL